MKRPYELSDLRATNDRMAQKQRLMAEYRQRTQRRRYERRQLALLALLMETGVVVKW